MSAAPPDFAAVEVADLGVTYRGAARPSLTDVSFGVEPGHIVGLLGPNGSGKSTLFKVLATLLPPTTGSARIFGCDVRRDRVGVRRQVGVVFQSPALDKELTARENLLYHGRLLGVPRQEVGRRADALLDVVGLAGDASRPIKRLSGGMRRRVEIAKAMLAAPPVLLMDEPTVGLDPAARQQTWAMLHGLRDAGHAATVLVSTHLMNDLGPDAARCGRIILLNEGQIVADDSPDVLASRVAGDVVTVVPEHLDDLERLADVIASQPGVAGEDIVTVGNALRIETPRGQALAMALLSDGAASVRLREVSVGRATMEDVFLRLTGRGLRDEAT